METFNRAIRTYQREDVSYLLAHGILKQVPEDENVCDTLFTLACQCGCVEKKLDFLAANSFDLFLKNSSNQTVIDLLQERIRQGKYPKNRHGSFIQIEDKKMLGKLNKMLDEKLHPVISRKTSQKNVYIGSAIACALVLLIIVGFAFSSGSGKNGNDTVSSTESVENTQK